jgi:hypothetical protein
MKASNDGIIIIRRAGIDTALITTSFAETGVVSDPVLHDLENAAQLLGLSLRQLGIRCILHAAQKNEPCNVETGRRISE